MHNTSVRPFTPWRDERIIFAGKSCKEATEGVVLGVEDSGDVFPEDDGRSQSGRPSNGVDCIGYLTEDKRQVSPRIIKGPAQAGDAERLARRTTTEHIGRLDFAQPDTGR
jgi:hypothetical protein